ncbi:hypothetical protein LV779_24545 [Streptomyces thinghirensis]|nr:hypothetical protein [Streptomyces thinghirensis]
MPGAIVRPSGRRGRLDQRADRRPRRGLTKTIGPMVLGQVPVLPGAPEARIDMVPQGPPSRGPSATWSGVVWPTAVLADGRQGGHRPAGVRRRLRDVAVRIRPAPAPAAPAHPRRCRAPAAPTLTHAGGHLAAASSGGGWSTTRNCWCSSGSCRSTPPPRRTRLRHLPDPDRHPGRACGRNAESRAGTGRPAYSN